MPSANKPAATPGTAYRVKYDWGQAHIAAFSYENVTEHSYLGAKLISEVSGMGSCYIPRSRRIPKQDACDTLAEALNRAIEEARRDMEQKKYFVNKINSTIGQLESLLRKTEAA